MSGIKVEWLLAGNPKNIYEVENSNLASIRMRAGLSLKINSNNLIVKIVNNHNIDKDTKILGVGKLTLVSDPQQAKKWLDIVNKHKKKGGKVFIDYTDHHLRESNKDTDLYKAYQELVYISDNVVTPSIYLENKISNNFNLKSYTIEDPIEVEIIEPKVTLHKIPTGLWFGHASNLNFLFEFLMFFKPALNFKIIIMSNLYPFPENLIQMLQQKISSNIELLIIPWSLQDMKLAANASDFCIIPCGIGDERKEGVSSNRLITALALGLPCFADSPQSYCEFNNFFNPLKTFDIEQFINNPKELQAKTLESQELISRRFSKSKILNDWKYYLTNII